ncbi:DNA-directed RNA polymerase subunit beta [Nocardia sp. NPDC050175]|uniref:DNA-directed RNA polymerase subunit beta n=1 Tax=Nocardia sp. NPDC050175 TaxID=3364317 RepID=UPI003795C60E
MDNLMFTDTPASRCTYYRRTCGLPAGIHPEVGRIIVRTGRIGAITMPASLGQYVRDDLLHSRITLGPIISHLRSRRWTFLCRPDLPTDMSRFPELLRRNVTVVPNGAEIALPAPIDTRTGQRHWIVAPRDTFRPSGLILLTAVHSCITRGPRC